CAQKIQPSSKFVVSSSSEESSSSDRTMDDSEVIGTVTLDKSVVPSGRDMGLYAGIETRLFFRGHRRRIPLLFEPGRIWVEYSPNNFPKGGNECFKELPWSIKCREGTELNKVLGALGIRREKRLNSIVEKVQRAHQNRVMATSGSAYDDIMKILACVAETEVDATVNMVPHLKKQKQESGKDIRASLKGVNLKVVEQEALDLAKRDPIRLDTQIRSSISQSTAEVLKVAAADRAEYEAEKASLVEQLKERTALCEQLQKEKVSWSEQLEREKAEQKEQFKAEAADMKKEAEADGKKTFDKVLLDRNNLVGAFYYWGLTRDDVVLTFAKKYSEIIFPNEDASPAADHPSEQTPAPEADDMTKEEVVRLRGKVIEMEKALSRARDSINRTQQVHNKLEYERRLHKSNFDNTFKELFELQCRYGKIKIEWDEVLRKESDRFVLLQKSHKDKRFVDESNKLECQRSLLSLTLYFEAEVDSERGLKEAYLKLLTERGIVPDPARVTFLVQEARNRHSIEAQRCSARAGVSIIWGSVGLLPDELEFCRGKEQ
ncbi:hypothetical protein GIB67_033117, partial [Kingdonia uniflora]